MYSGATHGVTAGEATVAGPVANGKGAALAYNTDGSVCKSNNNRQITRGRREFVQYDSQEHFQQSGFATSLIANPVRTAGTARPPKGMNLAVGTPRKRDATAGPRLNQIFKELMPQPTG
jgi:hypothetical protein